MTKVSGVYSIINKENDNLYIGSSLDIKRRWYLHKRDLVSNKHHSVYLQRAWNKYGEENFKFEILMLCQPELLIYHEQQFIDQLKPEYNICKKADSPLGVKRTEEVKTKLRELHKNDKPSELMKQRAIEANTGRVVSEETREKIRFSNLNKKRSDEAKSNMSIAQSKRERKPLSEDTKSKISSSNKGKKRTDEQRKRMSDSRLEYYKKLRDIDSSREEILARL